MKYYLNYWSNDYSNPTLIGVIPEDKADDWQKKHLKEVTEEDANLIKQYFKIRTELKQKGIDL